jgi:uncharacterized membrane protein YkvA (DUF1232 family)
MLRSHHPADGTTEGERDVRSFATWAKRANLLKRETFALYLLCRHPSVPWYVKALALVVVGYALSPIDLLPDFIPVLGYLDDLLLVPLGIWLVIRLAPAEVVAQCRARAAEIDEKVTRAGKVAAAVVVAIWVAAAALVAWLVIRAFR